MDERTYLSRFGECWRIPHSLRSALFVTCLAALVAAACSRGSDPSPVIARVGETTLTLEELQAALPPDVLERADRQDLLTFVNGWVRTELLDQAARRMGYAKDPRVRARLAEAARSILVDVFLEDELVVDPLISESEVRNYYTNNQEEFRRSADEVRVSILWFTDTAAAQRARDAILAGRGFEEVASDSSLGILASELETGFLTEAELGEELGSTVFRQAEGVLSRPTRVGTSYVLIQVEERQNAGTVRGLAEVREDIVARMAADLRSIKLEELLSRLLADSEVTLDIDTALRALRGSDRP
jgi:hypothetical protein